MPKDSVLEDTIALSSPTSRLHSGCNIAGYEIREVLGVGAHGITYRAYDRKLKCHVAIREYLPAFCAQREENGRVRAATIEQEKEFNLGYTNFLNVAKTLCRLDHDNIVKVVKIFKKFNTIYMVMELSLIHI